jgi:hypothetical protein
VTTIPVPKTNFGDEPESSALANLATTGTFGSESPGVDARPTRAGDGDAKAQIQRAAVSSWVALADAPPLISFAAALGQIQGRARKKKLNGMKLLGQLSESQLRDLFTRLRGGMSYAKALEFLQRTYGVRSSLGSLFIFFHRMERLSTSEKGVAK